MLGTKQTRDVLFPDILCIVWSWILLACHDSETHLIVSTVMLCIMQAIRFTEH